MISIRSEKENMHNAYMIGTKVYHKRDSENYKSALGRSKSCLIIDFERDR